MNPHTCQLNGRRVFPASRKEMTDADRVEKHKALRAHLLAGLTRMVRRCRLRALPALSQRTTMPHKARTDRRRVLRRATNPPLFSSKSLLLNAIGLACTLGRVTLFQPLKAANPSQSVASAKLTFLWRENAKTARMCSAVIVGEFCDCRFGGGQCGFAGFFGGRSAGSAGSFKAIVRVALSNRHRRKSIHARHRRRSGRRPFAALQCALRLQRFQLRAHVRQRWRNLQRHSGPALRASHLRYLSGALVSRQSGSAAVQRQQSERQSLRTRRTDLYAEQYNLLKRCSRSRLWNRQVNRIQGGADGSLRIWQFGAAQWALQRDV